MCGAAFLVKHEFAEKEKRPMLVCDIGGTTTDVGMLLASGLPRQAATITDVSGVMMNFSCPDVKSIGLGGGSIVRKDSPTSKLTIGPDSVGHHIKTRAHVFGGDVPTATDYAVACAKVSGHSLDVGDASRLPQAFYDNAEEYREVVKRMLENIIDRMKTTADDIEVLLVGGGAVLVNEGEVLKGASKVIKPKFSGVANVIGAAIARVSGTVDTVISTEGKTTQQAIESVAQLAIDRAVENGAVRETIELAEMDAIPLQYIANKSRVIVKAIGDFDFAHVAPTPPLLAPEEASEGDTIYVTSGSWRDGTFC
ncbi:Hydantoinase/oxoprolinase-domain-containing protein [Schizophyllum commune]